MLYTYSIEDKAYLPRNVFDTISPWNKFRRCLLKKDGTINYYLDNKDSTKKTDGTPAVLDGSDGQVMVEIPRFWYKTDLTTAQKFQGVSDLPKSGYKVFPAFYRDREGNGVLKEVDNIYIASFKSSLDEETKDFESLPNKKTIELTKDEINQTLKNMEKNKWYGWTALGYYDLYLLQLLYLIEYQDFNAQDNLGYGITYGGNGIPNIPTGAIINDGHVGTGWTLQYGNNSTNALDAGMKNGQHSISYRGLEDIYGNGFEIICDTDVYSKQYIEIKRGNNTKKINNILDSNKIQFDNTIKQWIIDFANNEELGFMPSNAIIDNKPSGCKNVIIKDSNDDGSAQIIRFGGRPKLGLCSGMFTLNICNKTSKGYSRLVY